MPYKQGRYSGVSFNVVKDPSYWGRIANRKRKTKQALQRKAEAKAQYEAELKAWHDKYPGSVLIKKA